MPAARTVKIRRPQGGEPLADPLVVWTGQEPRRVTARPPNRALEEALRQDREREAGGFFRPFVATTFISTFAISQAMGLGLDVAIVFAPVAGVIAGLGSVLLSRPGATTAGSMMVRAMAALSAVSIWVGLTIFGGLNLNPGGERSEVSRPR
jgi:hypothetical protein